jgi:hypothetical protein
MFDFLNAELARTRTTSALLTLAGLLAIWCGGILFHRHSSRSIGIGGGLIVFCLAAVYATAAWPDLFAGWRPSLFFFGAILVAIGAILSAVVARKDPELSLSRRRPRSKAELTGVSVALVGTLLAATLQIVSNGYNMRYPATHHRPNLTIDISIGAPVEHASLALIPIEITIKNGGQASLVVPLSHFEVYGFQISERAAEPTPETYKYPIEGSGTGWAVFSRHYSRHAELTCLRLIDFGPITDLMTHFGPGEEKSRRFLVPIPKIGATATYDGVRVMVATAAAVDEDLKIREGVMPTSRRDNGSTAIDIYTAWEIERSTLQLRLVTLPREIQAGWLVAPRAGLEGSCIENSDEPGELPEFPEPYIYFTYRNAAQAGLGEAEADLGEKFEDEYEPFWVHAAADRAVVETDPTEAPPTSGDE